jgi:hypothetical protein
MQRLGLRVVPMTAPHLMSMSDAWLLDHIAVLERTLSRLNAEGTPRAGRLVERYSMMLSRARLELARRCDDE